jgi:hypothetical protein
VHPITAFPPLLWISSHADPCISPDAPQSVNVPGTLTEKWRGSQHHF